MFDFGNEKVGKTVVTIASIIETIFIGIVGGVVFNLLDLPLAWMLGPLTSVLLYQTFTKRSLNWPISFRNSGQLLLGYSMGLSFTVESGRRIITQLPSMFLSTVAMIGLCLAVAFFVAKITDINLPSSVMGTTPGGLTQMVLLSEEIKGADQTIVTFMQTIRMLAVIFLVPTIVFHSAGNEIVQVTKPIESGSFTQLTLANGMLVLIILLIVASLAVKFKFPTPWIVGPLLTSAILTVTGWNPPHLPQTMIILAQFCMGVYLGLGIKFHALGNWKALLPYSIVAGVIIVFFSFVVSYILTLIHPMSLSTAFLSIAPGGLPEMGVTAHAVNADVSIVTAYQLFRILFILFIVPLFFRWFFGRSTVVGLGEKEKHLN
ncbi:AbrB family transcriptional regulator [Bacillus sp. Marseille-P3661]|uniref:AbrB family transcriptional regulator n=1 Tax=Bacillus sp. Marseille-P3661 TaxID=1936234 RepID=UPI0015E190B3|nr:AbrB family transcriptional regulator [Bacillus sp. Marseille-P3661]